MAGTKQDRKEAWERERVQRVLDYHNEKYGTHVTIKGKTTDVYPHLKGQINWDWVCYDIEISDEIAVEVKKLTDPKLEERGMIMWQLLEEVTNSLSKSNKLPGTFSLSVNIPNNYHLPFNKQNKRELGNLLREVIYKNAQRLKSGEKQDLKPEIMRQLSFQLDNRCSFTLHKLSNEDSVIYKGSGFIGWYSIGFDNSELEEFEQLVSQANIQLEKANVRETFLVLIEEGHRPKDPPEVAEAFKNINSTSYSEIRHVYFIRGGEVAEIPLPAIL